MHRFIKYNFIIMVSHFANKLLLISIVFCLTMISQISNAKEINHHVSFNLNGGLLNYFYANGSDHSISINSTKQTSSLSYEERVKCQKAIEKVYWNYRIWPKENHSLKPAFEQVANEEALRAKVDDILRKTNALQIYWNISITGEQLQAEIQRMAQHTKKPEMLHDLWNALDNNAHLVAECLARPILADKLIKESYGYDEKFHGELKQRAQKDLERFSDVNQMKQMSGNYSEVEWIRGLGDKEINGKKEKQSIKLSEEEWNALIKRLIQDFSNVQQKVAADVNSTSSNLDGLPDGKISLLREDKNRYYIIAIIEKAPERIKIATVVWEKIPFDTWWNNARSQFSLIIADSIYNYNLPLVLISTCGSDSWVPTATTNAPSARREHTAVWTGSEMIIWGGYTGSGTVNTGGRYDPATDTWLATSTTSAPSAREYHAAVWTGSEMIIWGGENTAQGFLNTGGRYNPVTNAWTATTTTNAPVGRANETAVWTGSEMIIWGGYNGASLNTGGRYNPGTDSWTATTTTNAPADRTNLTMVWTNSEMIVWGGVRSGSVLNTGGKYDPGTDSWTPTTTTNVPTGRSSHSAVWTGSEMIIFGGYAGGTNYLNTGGRYNPGTDSWIATTTVSAPTRQLHTAVWTGSEMIIWGGFNYGELNTGSKYNTGADGWVTISTTNAPDGRALHNAVWTGAEMIVWGGWTGSVYFNTGGKYNPATDSWVATATTNAPPARRNHAAVWTGSEMIIWGGFNGAVLNSGSRYHPGTDLWTATTTTNAPAARAYHTAVWSGTEMIIWGGLISGPVYFNTGSRYNPSLDSWAATTTTSAPDARSYHTAVWTSSEMIVWGGYNGTYLDTGGRYNPGTNTWLATTTTSAPTGRAYLAAVWTGAEMIIWGGLTSGGIYLNTGSRYDPVSNSWTAIATTNAPVGRAYHPAIWTGSDMIIWGGYNNSYSDTGGKYNLTSDSWNPTSMMNVPDLRSNHTAVWTDLEMIIWGGNNSSSYLNTGAKYCAYACTVPVFEGVQSVADPNLCQKGILITWYKPGIAGNEPTSITYNIRRYTNSTCSGGYTQIATGLPGATTSYTDTTTNAGTTYYYQVLAINNCNPGSPTPGNNSCSEAIADTVGTYPSGLTNNTAVDVDSCNDTGILIAWAVDPGDWGDAGSGTRTYSVSRAGNTIATGIPYGTTTFIDTTGTNGDTYTYRALYVNGCSFAATTSGASAADWGYPPIEIPNNTAADLSICADTGVLITWAQNPGRWGDNGTGTRTFDVLRDGNPIIIGIAYSTTTYADITGTNGQTYTYTVRYNNGCSKSADSDPGAFAADFVGTVPSTLTNNTAADIAQCDDTGVRISWNADPGNWNDDGIGTRTYDILRAGTALASGLAYGTTTFADTTGTNGDTYNYQVRYNNGCSLSSVTSGANEADWGFPPTGIPNNTAVDANACADTGVYLTWAKNPYRWGDNTVGTRTFDVLRDGIPIATSVNYNTTTYTDTTGTNATSYTYTVRYNNGCGFSADSSPGAAAADIVDATPCPAVDNTLLVSKSGTDAVISWTAVACADLTNYRVYGSTTYSTPFPSSWTILGNPVPATWNDLISSSYVAYKTISVDSCGNTSSN